LGTKEKQGGLTHSFLDSPEREEAVGLLHTGYSFQKDYMDGIQVLPVAAERN
jgi:hypothetical protein